MSEGKHPGGAPTKYNKEFNKQAYKLALLGATDKQIADFLNITETTLNNWKIKYPEFFESIKKGKLNADADVAKSLYQRAKGYKHYEDKLFQNGGKIISKRVVKCYPPDTAAAFIWLKNRQSGLWRDKKDIFIEGSIEIDMTEALNKIKENLGDS